MNTHHAQTVLVADVTGYDTAAYTTQTTECATLTWSQLGIDEVRELTSRAYRVPENASEQLLIVKTSFITHDAQNALLKLLEEPPVTTRFLFVLPLDFQALPTLRSRLSFIENTTEAAVAHVEWDTFVSQSVTERFKDIEQYCKAKDVEWQRAIKAGLIATLAEGGEATSLPHSALSGIHFVASHLLTRGAGNKMLLEDLALSWPLK